MPRIEFDELPDAARVWVFASDRPLRADEAETLLDEVDVFLDSWRAHGTPLRSARAWRDDRFLAIGVDPTAEQASGCSIDVLFRGLQQLERALGTSLVAGGRVFYRDASGVAQLARRAEVPALGARGVVTAGTTVFDTSVTDARAWRMRFAVPAGECWIGSLLEPAQASQASSRSATNASSARNG